MIRSLKSYASGEAALAADLIRIIELETLHFQGAALAANLIRNSKTYYSKDAAPAANLIRSLKSYSCKQTHKKDQQTKQTHVSEHKETDKFKPH